MRPIDPAPRDLRDLARSRRVFMLPRGRRFLGLAVAALLSEQSGAAMLQIYLTDSNTNPPFPNGNNYLQLTIWDGTDAAGKQISTGTGTYTATSSDVVFEIAPAAGLTSFEGSNFGLDEFAFNTSIKPLSTYTSGNFMLPSGWSIKMGKNADGYGMFNLLPTGGNGANTAANPLWFAITGISSDSISTYEVQSTKNAGQGNQDFAAHVINISDPASPGTSSSWFGGTPVPLPAAGWLLLSALGAIGLMFRGQRAGLRPV
jgi:hypothetical protein